MALLSTNNRKHCGHDKEEGKMCDYCIGERALLCETNY